MANETLYIGKVLVLVTEPFIMLVAILNKSVLIYGSTKIPSEE